MKVNIDKTLGVHVCNRCAWTLEDADFVFCSVQITAEPALCFDYRCPKCEFLGRWTVGLVNEDRFAVVLDMIKNIVRDEPPTKPQRTPVFRRDGNRLSNDRFNTN